MDEQGHIEGEDQKITIDLTVGDAQFDIVPNKTVKKTAGFFRFFQFNQ